MNIDIKLEIVTIICEQKKKKKKKIFCHKMIIEPQLANIKKAIHETRSIKTNRKSRL